MRQEVSALHITTTQRIIAKHSHMRRVTVETAQDAVKHLAMMSGRPTELEEDKRLRAELERATKLPIAELALIAEGWR